MEMETERGRERENRGELVSHVSITRGTRFGCAMCGQEINIRGKLLLVDGESGAVLCSVRCTYEYNVAVNASRRETKN